mgnify:CR=1 FL=1|tara:strand:+ start:566 stop:1156 length:591 start_codon:yes stop_codon:yes gene_type:complete
MPPKKKPRRKVKQPLQKQTQKQVVNIKIGDSKKKKKRRRRVAKQSQITPLAGNLGNTLNMGIYSDLSRLNTLENLINRLIPQTISKPITASIPTQTTMLGTGTTTDIPLSQIALMTELDDKPSRPSPSETAKRTPVKTTPPPKLKRASSISSLSSDEETMGLPRRGTDYLSTGTDTTRDLQTIDEMNLGASGFGEF